MDEWIDTSPHTSHFVTVNNIQLHYLDWGGEGPVLLLLSGLGNSVHIFDELAPHFTHDFHVIGLDRRGHGLSQRTQDGYDFPTLVEDLRLFLDQLGIQTVSLVGHSIAGEELTLFAQCYPEHVEKLIYLDAALDRTESRQLMLKYREMFTALQTWPPITKSYPIFRQWVQEQFPGFWSNAMENDLRQTLIYSRTGEIMDCGIPEQVARKMKESVRPPDFRVLKAPVLSFYAWGLNATSPDLAPEWKTQYQASLKEMRRFKQAQAQRLLKEAAQAQIVEMPEAHHYCFITHQDEVVQHMRRFLLGG